MMNTAWPSRSKEPRRVALRGVTVHSWLGGQQPEAQYYETGKI